MAKIEKKKEISLYEALASFKIDHRSFKSFEKKFSGREETTATWKKLLNK